LKIKKLRQIIGEVFLVFQESVLITTMTLARRLRSGLPRTDKTVDSADRAGGRRIPASGRFPWLRLHLAPFPKNFNFSNPVIK